MKTDSYLRLAAHAIEMAMRPLTPRQMLELARAQGFLPTHLSGATMHKTLMARLSEHIRKENVRSAFYRTEPGKFFLHRLARDCDLPAEYRIVYRGHQRAKAIRKENVLVAPREALASYAYGDFVAFDEMQFKNFYRSSCYFVDRSAAENDSAIKQFVTFTIVHHARKVLIYRRGKFTTTSDTLKGQLSVGFGGHVNDEDFTLFSLGGSAFQANAARELREELFLDDLYRDLGDTLKRTNILGYINVDGDDDADHHIAVLVSFRHRSAALPKKGELSINQISWLDLDARRNDLSDFDLWSAMIIRQLYDGVIKLP